MEINELTFIKLLPKNVSHINKSELINIVTHYKNISGFNLFRLDLWNNGIVINKRFSNVLSNLYHTQNIKDIGVTIIKPDSSFVDLIILDELLNYMFITLNKKIYLVLKIEDIKNDLLSGKIDSYGRFYNNNVKGKYKTIEVLD